MVGFWLIYTAYCSEFFDREERNNGVRKILQFVASPKLDLMNSTDLYTWVRDMRLHWFVEADLTGEKILTWEIISADLMMANDIVLKQISHVVK